MSGDIKKLVDELFDVAALYGQTRLGEAEVRKRWESRMRNLARHELMNFLMYLSASDGSIELQESQFIKDNLGEQISPEEICERIEADNLYSSTFEQKVPVVLKRMVRMDNEQSNLGKLEISQAEKYICLYEAIGKEFSSCDREVSESERSDLNTYISNLRCFYNANYSGSKEATEAGHFEHSFRKPALNDTVRNGQSGTEDKDFDENGETLEELLSQLNNLVGLSSVKSTVNQLIHYNSLSLIREERDLKQPTLTKHMVFYGNPGTGKTTIARLIAKIYRNLGILSKGHLVEVDRSGLVAGYVGHTALKVKEVLEKAKGGVLFIDEAYSLTYCRSENDFGWEAVDILVKAMEDCRDDLVIIAAGYPDRMIEFMDSNPGLRSRFNRFINFEDYSGEELFEIFERMLADSGFTATPAALEYTRNWIEKMEANSHNSYTPQYGLKIQKKNTMSETKKDFANARLIRNFLETSIMNQADRLYEMRNEIRDEELMRIEVEDVNKIV